MTSRFALVASAVSMFVAVFMGAFGAHAMKARVAADMLAVWQTAVQYQAWHALALFGISLLLARTPASRGFRGAGWLFVAGTIVFSGSLYALVLTGWRTLGAITPIGGLAFLGGWACLAVAAARMRN